jgi:hypothetical protein
LKQAIFGILTKAFLCPIYDRRSLYERRKTYFKNLMNIFRSDSDLLGSGMCGIVVLIIGKTPK